MLHYIYSSALVGSQTTFSLILTEERIAIQKSVIDLLIVATTLKAHKIQSVDVRFSDLVFCPAAF